MSAPSLSQVPTRAAIGPRGTTPLTVGVLGTFPPTFCGLASFSKSLCDALSAAGSEVSVVRVADGVECGDARIVGELSGGSRESIAACVDRLNRFDVVIIHHDVGIYGGEDGEDLVEVMRAVTVPMIVVAHAVPRLPTPHQRAVFESVLTMADRVVVVSDSVGERLHAHYDLWRGRVATIAHGVTLTAAAGLKRGGRPTLLTWGLLRPGKGVERVIHAMGALRELRGQPRYLVTGRTHPRALADDGESYREARLDQVKRDGLVGAVTFEPDYLGRGSLAALIQSCAAVVLPYDATEQVTSGVLVQAVASGRPVVATAFPHAVDLLGSGAGIVVAHDDPEEMTTALRRILTDPRLSGEMAAEGRRLAPTMSWSVVAEKYLLLAHVLLREQRARM
ncbi:glycosyltransferase [Mycolicibacterium sediminis]|uniref:Glycosyl transferase family 1 n=1 Tax=Mycolicibacterium sediminis TaxID=1286180 RepID=A0A7I7QQ17_9MYCO|nr:glycosyltransferase [Mycolicibacterium sediminis]BBY28180.1 glycosyl transferase family 1 [Mycolicibacterium sediminis]